ncbi:hypothetical protein BDW22DRAFT_1386488 [Trametopsis cervina]|nr:hypothetical protein BDW22DRAFT_1386488 [Trametopsis cervina]
MDSNHPLKTLLQLQLASDGSAVLHLPYVLSSLTAKDFEASSHLQKWTARVNSLVHSKDEGARWAGLCIALRTSVLSQILMLECAQSWVTAGLSFILKNETVPVLKASIRLLRYIFTTATGVPEFQRQVSTPNVPKFSSALMSITEKRDDVELQTLCLKTLAHLLVNYPTLHRPLQQSLSSTVLRYLNGSSPKPVPHVLLEASSTLYSVLHHTGGKVGAAAQWRKSLGDTLQFSWNAFTKLRSTYPVTDQHGRTPTHAEEDPLTSVPLQLDRLRTGVFIITDLLQVANSRPVPVPVGLLVQLCSALLSCSAEGQAEGPVDTVTHNMEASAVPQIHILGCTLMQNLAACVQQALAPHLTRLYHDVIQLLEQKVTAFERCSLLKTVHALLNDCPGLSDPQLPSRLSRAVLPTLAGLLTSQSDAQKEMQADDRGSDAKNRKGKKRVRGYEGDEVFKISREILCPTEEDGKVVLVTLDVIQLLLGGSALSPSIQSLIGRILLALCTSLPHIPAGLVSHDLSLHSQVYAKVHTSCVTFSSGTSNISKSFGLVLNGSSQGVDDSARWNVIDLLLHPRAPPLVRALPGVEPLSLFQATESHEEYETRRRLGIATLQEIISHPHPDTVQETRNVPLHAASNPPASFPSATALSSSVGSVVHHPVPVVPHIPAHEPAATISSTSANGPMDVSLSTPSVSFNRNEPPPATKEPSSSETASATTSLPPAPIPAVEAAAVEEDDDEPMPGIDMDSDSD